MASWIMSVLGAVFYALKRFKDKCLHHYFQHYYTRRIKSVGHGVRFNGVSRITGMEYVEIEANVHIGNNAFFRGEGGLFIGENTHFSRNVVIYTHSHDYHGQALPYDDNFRLRPVRIERNSWIGMNVVILPGATIREGAIVGAGSVVSGEVEAFAIVGASRPNLLKHRDREHYRELDQQKKYGGSNGRLLDDDQ